MTEFKNVKEKIEEDGWIYFIGSNGSESGLFKSLPDGGQAQLLYKCNIIPSFLDDCLKSIWKVEDGWVYFTEQSSLYRVSDEPDDPYSERSSYVDMISRKIRIDGTELMVVSRSAAGVGTFSQP